MNYADFVAGVIPTPLELRAGDLPEWALSQPLAAGSNNDWFEETVATTAQKLPSCVGRSTAQLLMMVIRRQYGREAIPRGYLLDGDAIWASRRMRRYGGDLKGGLQVHEGLEEAVLMGLLDGVRYGIVRFNPTPGYLDKMLRHMPVLVGVGTHEGWGRASRENGQIPFDLPNPYQGHAIVAGDVQFRAEETYIRGPNSWGLDWGLNGAWCMTDGQFAQALISDGVTLYLPDGIGMAWKDHLQKV